MIISITSITLLMVKIALIFELIEYRKGFFMLLVKRRLFIHKKKILNSCQYLPFNIALKDWKNIF